MIEKKTWKYKVRPLLQMPTGCLGVPLSDGSVALIDADDRHIAEGWNWTAIPSKNGVYAVRGGARLHCAILGVPRADHKNGNTLDNRRSNLRPASSAENARNRARASNNTSGFKGVSFRKDRGTWLAAIRVGEKLIKIGTYQRALDAAVAYDDAARKHFGEFAFLNFPDYDAQADFAGSLEVGYEAIRERVAAGGPEWQQNKDGENV